MITPTALEVEEPHQTTAMSLDAPDVSEQVTLVALDGSRVQISKVNCVLSSMLQVVIDAEPTIEDIKLDEVFDGEVLQILVDYLNMRKGVPAEPIIKPLPSSKPFKQIVPEAEGEFIERLYNTYLCSEFKEVRHKYYKIISAANFMHIDGLLHLLSARLAYIFKTKTKQEIVDFLK
jgi:hypothetical protein